MSQVFVFDDSDLDIFYHGNWTTLAAVTTLAISGGTTNEYNSTVHGSHTAGDTLTYSFTGTALGVWGTLDRTAILGSPNATFTIDNLPPFTFNQTGHVKPDLPNNSMSHLLLYQSPRLADGEHTLTVTIASSATQAMFYVDFFMIEKDGPGTVIVDDFDTRISFEGDWVTAGAQYEYTHTTHGMPPRGKGDMSFPFYGESILLYGTTTRLGSPAISVTIDGVQKNTSTSMSAINPQESTLGAHTIIFAADGLAENQEHTLIMSALSLENMWLFDYVLYRTKDASGVVTIPAPVPTQAGSNSPEIGPIVGCVVGGVVLISLIAFWYISKRRRSARKTSDAIPFTRRGSSSATVETRSVHSILSSRSTDGTIIRQASLNTPSGILRNGITTSSSVSAVDRPRVRISQTRSMSRMSSTSISVTSLSQSTGQTNGMPTRDLSPKVQYGGGFQVSDENGQEVPVAPPMVLRA